MIGAAEIAVQVTIVFIGGTAFQVTRIGSREWGITLALGFMSIPLGAFIRLLPNQPFESLLILARLLPKPEGGLPRVRPDIEGNSAIKPTHNNPAAFAFSEDGQPRSSFIITTRDTLMGRLLSIYVARQSLTFSSFAPRSGAWRASRSRGTLSDPARYDPPGFSAALWAGKEVPVPPRHKV
jgi:Ca2+-transporting ATPase